MNLKKKILIMIFFCSVWFLLQNVCYAGSQRLNSLDYNVKLRENGNMEVVETWDIYISETNTLFKDFKLDSSKYTGITNVKVKNLTTNEELTQIDQEMYHVTKDCYYGLKTKSNKFEIAWGVGLDNSSDTRTYQISYTVQDAITVYQDCSQLYWQFVSTDNGIRARKVTGTIELPKTVQDLEKLRVWAHGPLNGEITKMANDLVSFSVNDFDAGTMLEVRIVVEEPMFTEEARKISKNQLDKIIAEETKWADQANQERRSSRMMIGAIAVVYLLVLAFFGKKIIKYRREWKLTPEEEYEVNVGEYFRDIPREKEATPAEAAFLYYLGKGKMPQSAVFSATILQLCLKGYLAFDVEDKKNIKINFLEPMMSEDFKALKASEKSVLKVLRRAAGYHNTSLTMKDLKNYAKREYESFGTIADLEIDAKKAHSFNGNYDVEKETKVSLNKFKIVGYMMGMVMVIIMAAPFLVVLLPLLIEWLICVICLRKINKKINVLTEQGEIERQQWKGLKKYMEDFSLLKDREIPDLVLWEKYLVYATAFGISDKVIEQLKVVYPQMADLDRNTYTYMYLMSNDSFSRGFISELNRGTSSAYSAYRAAYSAAHSSDSSGSGGGGGFSGGGGGRWRRWPEWVGR